MRGRDVGGVELPDDMQLICWRGSADRRGTQSEIAMLSYKGVKFCIG